MFPREFAEDIRQAREGYSARGASLGAQTAPYVTDTASPSSNPSPLRAENRDREHYDVLGLTRDGSRKLGLNDHLIPLTFAVADFDELVALAARQNKLFGAVGLGALPDDEFREITAAVWAHRDRFVPMRGNRGTARTDADEVRSAALSDAAYRLLMLLRCEHAARVERGGTFRITPKSMADRNVLPGWGRKLYQRARDELEAAGFIELASEGTSRRGGRIADEWRLTDRALTPSRAILADLKRS